MQTRPKPNTATLILAELRQGERTTPELMAAAGVSRNAVLCCIAGLRDHGYRITDAVAGGRRHRGGHHDARWRLVFDVERPAVRICALPGCTTPLNRYNRSRYCLVHRRRVAVQLAACYLLLSASMQDALYPSAFRSVRGWTQALEEARWPLAWDHAPA